MLNMVNRKAPKNQLGAPISLNVSQKMAVNHASGPLLITAGAGSGKTRTLTQRVIKLMESGVPAHKIIAITFTNKAAEEMLKRVVSRWGLKTKKDDLPFIGTFHSLGARILRRETPLFKRTASFVIFDDADSLSLIKKLIKNLEPPKPWLKPPPRIQKEISEIKNTLMNPEEHPEDFIGLVWGKYERALQGQNAFDFDDLIEKVVRLFQKYPAVLKKYHQRWEHVLVDECQDINLAQYELLRQLAAKHKNLFAIGDDHQAIYGFRFADFRYFLNFEEDWPGAKVLSLGENYRSTGNIVRAAASVIQNNKFQRPKKLWTNNAEGSLIKIIGAADQEDEADKIVADILNYRPLIKETAILYRTNAQSRALEQMLNYHSLPYEIFGGVKFYERKEIKDVVSALRYGLNPKDTVSLERLEKSLGKNKSRELKEKLPLMARKLTILELIGFFLKTSHYFDYLGSKFQNVEERLENIQELLNFASQFVSLEEFLERIALLQATDRIKSEARKSESIKLMTIHLAKGLEFDSVYIAGVNEGILPHQKSLRSLGDLEEERRLMYVAMTRAKQRLTIGFYDLASRFLYEIPPELVDFTGFGEMKEGDEIYLV